eukprot:9216175-Alexandrium_andersonii.AAC.1
MPGLRPGLSEVCLAMVAPLGALRVFQVRLAWEPNSAAHQPSFRFASRRASPRMAAPWWAS